MTTITPEAIPQVQEDVLERYDAFYGDQQVLVLTSRDYRVSAAIAIEKYNMMLLGDPEELVDKDLALSLNEARFLTVFPRDEEPALENMLGVVRITDMDPATGTLRSFREASEVTGDPYATIWQHFIEQTGQTDPHKVFDVNTYGISASVWEAATDDRELFNTVKYNLMTAMVKEGMRLKETRGATHGISYFNEFSWDIFKSKGYKWDRLNGYEAENDKWVLEDGTIVEGQPLIPTVLDFEEHLARMRQPASKHLGELALHLLQDELK